MTIKIAIAGGGVVGNNIAQHLVNHPNFNDEFQIDIFDSKEYMGRGKPYIDDSRHLLLNIPSEEMTVSKDPYGFINWLKGQSIPLYNYNARKHFGEYTLDMLERIADSYGNIRLVSERVEDVIYDADDITYKICTKAHAAKYDHVFLAVGQLGYTDPYGLKGRKNYLHNPYPVNEKVRDIDGDIGIIGTGLSAIDCVRYLLIEREMDRVHIFSRSGDMPSVRGETHHLEVQHFTEEAVDSFIKDDLIPLEKIIKLFKKEMDAQNIDSGLFYRHPESTLEDLKYDIANAEAVGKLQYLIIAVNSLFSRVFPYFSKSDKETFMKEIHPYIDKNHSPMPMEVAEQLIEWAEAGRVVLSDGIQQIEADEKYIVKTDDETFEVDWVINATGPAKDITKEDAPLISNMLDRLLIAPGSLGGIMVDRDHKVISPRYGTLEGMYAMGHLTFDSDYMSNSVGILVENTEIMVRGFMEKIT